MRIPESPEPIEQVTIKMPNERLRAVAIISAAITILVLILL